MHIDAKHQDGKLKPISGAESGIRIYGEALLTKFAVEVATYHKIAERSYSAWPEPPLRCKSSGQEGR